MNVNTRINSLPVRVLASVALALACVGPMLVSASDVPKRELSAAAPGPRAHSAAKIAEASMQAQLERLALEAAMVDSSAFGQLRMLRDVEAKVIEAPRGAGGGENCR
ncbi:MAG TPA: hypothetical protein VJS42_18110 [Steroidobacteraceae bacterium]|nr:hypothetical protein [Steroidobacteraceae bacterium]